MFKLITTLCLLFVCTHVESGDGCTHEELSLDALNSGGQQICTGATLKRKNHHYPRGPCAGHDEL